MFKVRSQLVSQIQKSVTPFFILTSHVVLQAESMYEIKIKQHSVE